METRFANFKFVFSLLVAMLTMSLLASPTSAQSTTGDLVGVVSSPDGVIPGATITATDNATGRSRTVTASSDGSFAIRQLTFGLYTVKVTAAGFKTLTAADVKIDVGREYSLNPTLEVGALEATVTVTAGADIVNSSNSELSSTVSARQVLELPINGRNPLNLLNLQAGVNVTSNSINGQRSSSVNFTRDGVNIQDNFIRTGGFVQDQPTVDDTGEFTVITQNAGAELGSGSTQVQLVTPRGGRAFHGGLFEFNRNSYLGANNFFNKSTGRFVATDPTVVAGSAQVGDERNPRPFLNRNQFGGKLSGPLVLPRFGEGGPSFYKDKAFFFINYEGFRQRTEAPANRTILLAAARTGNFSYVDASGVTRTVNVLTGDGLNLSTVTNQRAFDNAGGVLSVDPTIQSRVLDRVPASGNFTTTGINYLQVFRYNLRDVENRDRVTGRFDVDINAYNTLNFVYSWNDIIDDRADVDGGGYGARPFGSQGGPTKLYVLAYTLTRPSGFTNEIRGAFQRSEPKFFGGDLPSDFIIGNLLVANPEPTFRDQGRDTDYYTLQDNASFALGNHALRFGGQIQRYKIVSSGSGGTGIPTFSITNTNNTATPRLAAGLFPGGINNTDRGRADALRYFLGGIVGSGSITVNATSQDSGFVPGAPSVQDLRFEQYALYVADQWRATPRLTLNLGLRYELYTPLRNPQGLYLEPVIPEGTDPVQAILNPDGQYQFVGGNAGKKNAFFKTDKNNFGPVAGFSYSPEFKNKFLGGIFSGEGKTVIRGGVRVNYVNDEYLRSVDNAAGGNVGLSSFTINALNPATALTQLNARFNALPPLGQAPAFTLPRTFADNNSPAINSFGTVFAVDPELQVQRTVEYNFGIQREIGFQTAIEFRYVGGRSDNLVRGLDFNQISIRDNGYLADFVRAQQNLALSGDVSGAFNPAIPGSQPTPFFNRLPSGGLLNNATVIGQLQNGTPGDLALIYIQNNLDEGLLLPNLNTGVADLLLNSGRYRYNSLQAEIRRRFMQGLSLQANYTFQKVLTDVPADQQTRFDPRLDNLQPELEYSRADYDRAHTFNFNAIYELPFGKTKRFLNQGGWLDRLVGGFQFASIVFVSSGSPISIKDVRGTLNRNARSGRQTAFSSLTTDQIKDLIGVFRTPDGVFFIDPSVLNITKNAAGVVTEVRGASPIGEAPFDGQVFFRNEPGQSGGLTRAFINGPILVNWDASLTKNVQIKESMKIQLRLEAFNVLNRTNFNIGENSGVFDINSANFGLITATRGGTGGQRVVQLGARFEF
jgi:Carboxypeptidase regulatory-like domain